VGTPARIEAYPKVVRLTSARQRMRLVITGVYQDGSERDLTRAAQLTSDNLAVAAIQEGIVVPRADGQATVAVRVGNWQVTVPVAVSHQGRPDPVSFRHDTLPALTKLGCNAGACHGSPSGKGGFALSMLGYDPEADALALVYADGNRRTNILEPEKSLLLRKPTLRVAHGGGLRLRPTDPAYRVLCQWIAEGCRLDHPDSPRCVRVEVYPPCGRVVRRPAHTQQLHVLAHFSDGSDRDVTALASYTSSDDQVASVTAEGLVVGASRGTAAISVRYLDEVVSRDFTFVEEVPDFVWSNPPAANYVDDLVYEQLRLLSYLPAETCSDQVFLRRVSLDVTGLLPTVEETRAFLDDRSVDKRARLIDRLLHGADYARFWSHQLADLLRVNPTRLTDKGARTYFDWIVHSVASNMPLDQFATALLTASGNTAENPPANYYRAVPDANAAAETTAQLFLGIRIACARCHNHPFERWTQDNYYGLAAVFQRVGRKRADDGALFVYSARTGETRQPRSGRDVKPWLPLKGEAVVGPREDRREVFARWLTAPNNPFFARVEVNRLWARLLGRGIVEPVDDFRTTNPPANAKLLDALAQDFVSHGFDRRHILRVILNSRTYQQQTTKNRFNRLDEKYFSSARARLLSAEQLLDAVSRVTAIPEHFWRMPEGSWATQLPISAPSPFLAAFGQPPRESACQCERVTEPSLQQALQLLNGSTVRDRVHSPESRLHQLLAAGKSVREIHDEIYLAALCRKPQPVEVERALRYVAAKGDRREAMEDLLWAVLNTREFIFQH
jgi:hypothetical protein